MTEYDILSNIDQCKSNLDILTYFNNTKQDFVDFVKCYIEIDKVIRKNKNENEQVSQIDVNNEISNMKCMLIENSTKLSEIPYKIRDNIISLENNIKNNLNHDTINTMNNALQNTLSNHTFNDKINSIEKTLDKFFSTASSKKGEQAEELLGDLLIKTFKNTEIIDSHAKPHSGDFQLVMDNKPTILIDSKHFKSSVPKVDLQKFISDIQLNNCSGILCNVFGGIANREHLEIEIIDNNIIVYIHDHNFNPDIFKVAVNIIYYMTDIIKQNSNNGKICVDKELFNSMKIEYNYFLQAFNQQILNIKTSINTLSQLHFNMIDQFFLRQANKIDANKKLMCNICGSNYANDQTLKKHIKNKH
jgi:hypothetical protein